MVISRTTVIGLHGTSSGGGQRGSVVASRSQHKPGQLVSLVT
jgi:hypothetical protein